MQKVIDLSIQIVNFNTKKYLINCLQSVFQDLSDSQLSFEINVLDNNSNDDLSDLNNFFTNFQNKSLKIYQSRENLGFGAGHNFLARLTNAKYLLLLNPDIVIENIGCISKLYNRIIQDIPIKVIGPKLYNRKGENQAWDHGESQGFKAKFMNSIGWGFWKNRDQESECAWVSGAVLLIEKFSFDQVGGFDENFFLYKEEEDLCLRLRQQNYQVLYFPEIEIMHIGSVVAKKEKYLFKSCRYFFGKHVLKIKHV